MTTTATVETLTAEVRVLMVGSRQITLSVAKQLDAVGLAKLTVFGRIKIGGDYDWVIGADQHGRLARAKYRRPFPDVGPVIFAEDLGGRKVTMCAADLPRLRISVLYAGRPLHFTEGAIQPCGEAEHTSWRQGPRCEHWRANGLDEHIRQQFDEYDAEVARHKAAAEAPLIVLAGLR